MMTSKIELVVINRHIYEICVLYMETFLKIKGLWKYMKVSILDSIDDHDQFVIVKKEDKVVGFTKTYILRDINFHTGEINFPHALQGKIKLLFKKVNEH